mgnify:CR=1 FL=1
MSRSLKYIDLFSGAGGFSLGFDNKGFQNVFSVDIEPSFCETYNHNFPSHNLIHKDICDVKDAELKYLKEYDEIDVVIGGPPCQGFSIAGNIGRKFIDDPRNKLFKEFVRVVKVVEPTYFVMENVARLYNHNKGNTRKGAVINRSQCYNGKTNQYIKRDKTTGKFMSAKVSPYKGVTKEKIKQNGN